MLPGSVMVRNNKGLPLRRKRLSAGLSQLRLALEARISRFRLHLCERGLYGLRPDEMARADRVIAKWKRARAAERAALRQR